MYLFFDTETTGVPKNYKASPTDVENWPRIIQLAWAYFDQDGSLIAKSCDLIYPNGWEIPEEKFWIDNGYSTEESKIKGVPIDKVLFRFLSVLDQCKYLIAHNLNFDKPIVQAEMIRLKMKSENRPSQFCTMMSTTNICKIPHSNGRGMKWPKLEELHRHLFKAEFEGAHDALNDVMATAKCFFELKSRNLISLS